ncbi:bifunctional biotin--[acetyl-CoA-carboxylase] ligase/biotin operon repressor BirA, partial [Vibrio alfacsensis]
IVRGIDATGAVLLETEAGIQPFIGGEISLRKLN